MSRDVKHKHTHTHTHTHTHIHTYTHTHTHTHTHTYTLTRSHTHPHTHTNERYKWQNVYKLDEGNISMITELSNMLDWAAFTLTDTFFVLSTHKDAHEHTHTHTHTHTKKEAITENNTLYIKNGDWSFDALC